MPTAVIAGGSLAGLATALALGRAGYRVRVLERCPAPPEGPLVQAAERWHRPSVPQAGHSHNLTGLGVRTLREHAPHVLDEVLRAGAQLLDLTAAMPAGITDRSRREGDEDLVALGCRRTTLELALYRAVRDTPGVGIRHETTVRGLLLDRFPRVTGVVVDGGERLDADFVVDATGRRAASASWLSAAGVPVPEDLIHPSDIAVYTRFYRRKSSDLPGPLNRGNAAGGIWDHYAAFVHLGDDDTHSLVFTVLPGDPAVRALRDTEVFTAAARATPWLAQWADAGEPISTVRALTCPPNILRGTATTPRPAVAGLHQVGDAACVTDPLFGRGMSLALAHAFALGELLTTRPANDPLLGPDAARSTTALMRPWYEHAVRADTERSAHWHAAVTNPPTPGRPAGLLLPAQATAAQRDAHTWRDLIRMLMTLTPYDTDRTGHVWEKRAHAPGGPAAPDRHEFTRLLTVAEGT
ncbi:NAD(P)/FAD-dependent oxidoreductase [Streptomyces sp. NPDC012825]|uniref:NAD(P)/FAD-dependent oxidoreductase n=1 Tax=Streptomyces sp. NPDC012825 TaxID=3364851 RepID=UPI0036CEC7BC